MTDNIQLMTMQEAAKILKVSERTVRRYIKDGHLKGYKLEGAYRITDKELKRFLKNREVSKLKK